MAVALSERVLDNPTLNSVLFIDQEGQIQIRDQNRAVEVLLLSDANSIEHKIVQIAMNLSLSRENASLNERVALGEKQILHLLEENTKIQDELTTKQMQEDAKALRAAEIKEGILDILTAPLFIVVHPFFMLFKPIIGACKILIPGSFAMRTRLNEMELYKTFHPNASLTESYNYVKENPLNRDPDNYTPLIERFKANHPEGTYQECVRYIKEKLRPETRLQLKCTGRGRTGFQFVREKNETLEIENSSGIRLYLY
ncbi:hypothetical protein EB008_01880 [bacterium]|nr:hypothetical protein [bacterium]